MVEEDEEEWDVGDLSKLDFSQVFAADEADYDSSSLSGSGGVGGGGFLGRRAQHLVNLLAQPDDCLVRNILQIWDSDLERIKSLDQSQILTDINAALLQGLAQISLSPLSLFAWLAKAFPNHVIDAKFFPDFPSNTGMAKVIQSIRWNFYCRMSVVTSTAAFTTSALL